jgi:hypothetical protein
MNKCGKLLAYGRSVDVCTDLSIDEWLGAGVLIKI